MNLMNCPVCDHEILDRMGTICPSCGHTVGYFNGDKKRKRYGKFFAMSVFLPFISFITIIFASLNKYALIVATIIYLAIAYISIPLRFKELFASTYEKAFFWGIWLMINALLVSLIINNFSKL